MPGSRIESTPAVRRATCSAELVSAVSAFADVAKSVIVGARAKSQR